MSIFQERACRVCGGELDTILDLGALHPSCFLGPGEIEIPRVPHDLAVCCDCRLVQLRHTVEPDVMFRQYWYQSGINEVMRAELADVVTAIRARVTIEPGDLVLDIGANDGTLLAAYGKGPLRIAFEPALNLNDALRSHAEILVPDYFPRGLTELPRAAGQVKAITAIACFYDLDDPVTFLRHVHDLLAPDGVFVVQFQDWYQMQKATAFDNICTEHLFYPSLGAIERMAEAADLCVIDAEIRSINGGSYRLFLSKNPRAGVSANVWALRHLEDGCEDWDTFDRFAWRVTEAKRQILEALSVLRYDGQTIDIYGASTKGNTLCQWLGLSTRLIRQAIERSPAKFGLRLPGSGIPIVSEHIGRADPADAWLCNIWQFRSAVLEREAAYLRQGGLVLFPLPHVEIVKEAAHVA